MCRFEAYPSLGWSHSCLRYLTVEELFLEGWYCTFVFDRGICQRSCWLDPVRSWPMISDPAIWTCDGSYFSLSTSEGHRPGNILFAQSSSGKISDVAANACKAALRACTKGSLNDRVNAAISTFCLVYGALVTTESAPGVHTYICTHIPCDFA